MEEIKKLGNIELFKTFLAVHYQYFNLYESEFKDNPRINDYILILKHVTENIKTQEELENLYYALFNEAKKRGLKSMFTGKYITDTIDFECWKISMFNSPTYLREIEATNFTGGYDVSYVDDEIMGFDYPVRNACKILNEKGYITYWSSANKEDCINRKGQVIKDKSVAYILIDSTILTDNLKELLQLNGVCNFWGIAQNYNDSGKYYGIWAEIESLDVTCESISAVLSKKALDLPILEKSENYPKKL